MSKKNINQIRCLVDGVVDLAKIESRESGSAREDCDINELVKEAMADQQSEISRKTLFVKTHLSRSIDSLRLDGGKIKQLFGNLLSNAVRFTSSGEIFVSTHFDEVKKAVKISFEDTGIGIPEEKISHLFYGLEVIEKDTEGKKGSGLGLAISKAIALHYQGDIQIESKVDEGSRFTVVLPIAGLVGSDFIKKNP